MTVTVEAIGGPHDGALIAVAKGIRQIRFLLPPDPVPWPVSEAAPDPDGGNVREVVYDIKPHPRRRRWGAIYAPLYWPPEL